MTDLYENREYYDMIIYASNGHEQRVHKCILFKQIPKLENIDTKEIKHSEKNYEEPYCPLINFHNETFKVLRDLVEFVYLGAILDAIHDRLALLDLSVRLEYVKLTDYILAGISPEDFKDNDEIVEFVSKLGKIKGIADKIKEKIQELFVDKKYRTDLDSLNNITSKEIPSLISKHGNEFYCQRSLHNSNQRGDGLTLYFTLLEDIIRNVNYNELYIIKKKPIKIENIAFTNCNCGPFGYIRSKYEIVSWRFLTKQQVLKMFPEFEEIILEKMYTPYDICGKKIYDLSYHNSKLLNNSKSYDKMIELSQFHSMDLSNFSEKYLKSLGYY